MTLDVRYYGTDLSRAAAAQLWGVAGYNMNLKGTQNQSSWGRDAVVGSISFDLTSKDLK